ncbi:MAG: hypothetical protein ACW980_20555, partial [Promethearchaeota archaeon]
YLIPFLKANSNFTNGLELGTQVYEVKHYDEITWKNTVNFSISPSYWLGGEANIVGAKSKLTVVRWRTRDFITSEIFSKFIYSNEILSLLPIVSNYGYGKAYIDEYYTHSYFVWEYTFQYYSFTTREFDIYRDFQVNISMIMKNPQDLKQMLDDYNDYASKINNNKTLQSLNISFSTLSGDDFIWHFIIGRFAIAHPINDYLTTLERVLDYKNVTIEDNTIIFQKHGEKNYIIEVAYNPQGLIETFIVKNLEGYIIYKITSFYPKTVFYIILGIISLCVLGIVTISIYWKIRLKRKIE